MTTNVYDGLQQLMASDSRWSIDHGGNRVIVVDDCGFDKIELEKNRCHMFAGDGPLIGRWKEWIRKPPGERGQQPPVNGISVCTVKLKDGSIYFERAQLPHGKGRFAGTGREFARDCWTANGDARRAVSTAILRDPKSGGSVKFFDIRAKSHNLDVASTYDAVLKKLETTGNVMYTNASGSIDIVPFSEAVKTDAELKNLAAKVASGAVAFSAPCELAQQPWTEDEIARFTSMFDDDDEE